jgi:outer membrane protein
VRAQSTVASDQQALTKAETALEYAQLLVKNALSRSLQSPELLNAEVVPTSTMQLPSQEAVVPTEDLVNDALGHRADLAQLRIDMANRRISLKSVRNAMLPTVNAFAYYGGSGLSGAQNPAATCPNAPPEFCVAPGAIAPVSYGSSLNELVNSTAPDKGVGFTLNIPLRNRVGEATQVRSELEYRQAEVHLQQFENQVRLEVRNAQFTLQQNRAAVEAAQAAVDFERQSLDAEQKKFGLGASTTTLVLQQQRDLANAESNLLSAMTLFEKSQVDLDRATGLLLDHEGIDINDALRGQVTHLPTVPYVTANPAALTPPPSQ